MEENLKRYIKEFKKGDYSSFDDFYNALKEKIFYNIFALTKSYELSEDLLQDTFVKFLESINEIDDENNAIGLLFVMSRNLTLDYLKKHKKVRLIDETKDTLKSHDEEHVDKNILLEKIKNILKPKEFEIFTLHVLSELTFEEISKMKKRPLGTITWAYNNAIKKLKGGINIWWNLIAIKK